MALSEEQTELTFEQYCSLDGDGRAMKADAYVLGGLRGGWVFGAYFHTIVKGQIFATPVARINRITYKEAA